MATYMDITLKERVDPQELLARLKGVLPADFRMLSISEVPLKSPSLMSQVAGADYVFFIPGDRDTIELALAGLLVSERIEVQRKAKKKKKRGRWMRQEMRTIDVKPNIKSLALREELCKDGLVALDVSLVTVESRGLRPSELIGLLGADSRKCRVLRTRTRFARVENKPITGLEGEAAVTELGLS